MCIFVGDMSNTIQIRGKLIDLSTPQVMGILNVTPDSFYAGSRVQTEDEIVKRCHQIIDEGASMIDVGGYSTRPGGTEVSESEEMERLHVMELPLLVGISRKSMIFKLLGITPTESLNGTTVLNTISLMKGAHILRVHDVKQAVECVRIVQSLNSKIVK